VIPLNAYWSPSGRLVRTADQGGVTVWNGATGDRIRSWPGLIHLAAAIDPSDRFLATATDLGEIDVWDINSGLLLNVIEDRIGWMEPQALSLGDSLCFTKDSKYLIFGGNSSLVKIWEWAACHPLRVEKKSGDQFSPALAGSAGVADAVAKY